MTKAEEAENSLITSSGCAICKRLGYGIVPACIHHVRRCGGKRKYAPKIGLCPRHHQEGRFAIHRGRLSFESQYEVTEWELVGEVELLLAVHDMIPTWKGHK